MYIKVSKVMAKELQKVFPKYSISCVKMTKDEYRWNVSTDTYHNGNDYDYNSGCFKVIRVCYPNSYYAVPQYFSTNDLLSVFKTSDKTWTGFADRMKEVIEI